MSSRAQNTACPHADCPNRCLTGRLAAFESLHSQIAVFHEEDVMNPTGLLLAVVLGLLAGCTQAPEQTAGQPAPGNAATAGTAAESARLDVGAGTYLADLDHSTLGFHIRHMGMSNYFARFTDYQVKVDYVPDNLAASSISVVIDPTSLGLDYRGDFKATHPNSQSNTFVEELMGDQFFAAAKYPRIEFHSTRIEPSGPGRYSITGDLSLHGQTHPVTLAATVVGSKADHPMYGGLDVFGFSATGSFSRSAFGMDYLVAPGVLGDEISLRFEGEFHEQKAPAEAASKT
ncbi:MAG: YceI family protein [Gammaproteobacteria bacterium]|nr:YceI family protein [Gammaproteobacteria bacterium]